MCINIPNIVNKTSPVMNHCDTKMQSRTAGANYLKENSNTSSKKNKLHPQKMREVSGITPTKEILLQPPSWTIRQSSHKIGTC